MHVRLPLGSGAVEVDIPDNWINGRCYRSVAFTEAGDERAELLAAFQEPVGIDSFEDVVRGKSTCVIVVDPNFPDLFREFIPEFLEELESASSLSHENILILVANSSWQPKSPAWIEEHVGEDIRSRFPIEIHDPFDEGACTDAGSVMNDIPLRINKKYMDAELRILLGPVAPDFIHGFTGGRTLLLPGIAPMSTIKALYSYERMNMPSVGYGQIRDNLLHVAGMQAIHAAGCDLTVAPLVTPDRRLSEVVLGDPGKAFLTAASRSREKMGTAVPEQMDIVVTSGGGAPYDSTFYGAVNALAAVEPILKRAGTIVLTADMAEGFGPRPLRELLLNSGDVEGFARYFADNTRFVPGQWFVQRYLRLAHEHEIIVHSPGISDDDLWRMGMTPSGDLQEAIEVAMQSHGQRCKICALPDGPGSLPFVGETVSFFA